MEVEDQRLIGAFAAQAAVVLGHIRLSRAAAEAAPLAEANKVRAALLAAVGHDFRTPLAAAKAFVSTLLSFDIDLATDDRRELLEAADTSLDRLAALVDNLLDMSRLQAGAMSIDVQPGSVDEVVARALDDLGEDGRTIVLDAPEDLPLSGRGGLHAWDGRQGDDHGEARATKQPRETCASTWHNCAASSSPTPRAPASC